MDEERLEDEEKRNKKKVYYKIITINRTINYGLKRSWFFVPTKSYYYLTRLLDESLTMMMYCNLKTAEKGRRELFVNLLTMRWRVKHSTFVCCACFYFLSLYIATLIHSIFVED